MVMVRTLEFGTKVEKSQDFEISGIREHEKYKKVQNNAKL